MKEDHGTSASGAPWDDPTLYERLRQEQSQHRGRGLRIEAGGGFIRQQNGRCLLYTSDAADE